MAITSRRIFGSSLEIWNFPGFRVVMKNRNLFRRTGNHRFRAVFKQEEGLTVFLRKFWLFMVHSKIRILPDFQISVENVPASDDSYKCCIRICPRDES